MRHRTIVPLVLVVGLLAGRTAWADARVEKAREHYLQGDALYKLDKYADALHEYEQAYIAKPDPSFLYNIAQCHRLMGNRADSLRFYRRYLKDAPAAPNRAIAEKHIHELEAALAHPTERGSEPPRAADGAPAPSPAPAPMPMPAPSPSAGMPAPTPTPVSSTVPNLALSPSQADTQPASALSTDAGATSTGHQDDHHPFYTRWWFWTAVGVVVVGAVVIAASASHDPACPSGSICK